jgi:hypothetical protein
MEQSILQMISMFAGSDWLAVLALFAIALFYFLAPVFHYSEANRFWIVAALWTLIIRFGIGFCRIAWIYLEQWDIMSGFGFGSRGPGFSGRPGGPMGMGGNQNSTLSKMLEIGFPPLEAGLFVLALFLFVLWLTGLRRREIPPPDLLHRVGQ